MTSLPLGSTAPSAPGPAKAANPGPANPGLALIRIALSPAGLLATVVLLIFVLPARVIVPGLTSIGRPGTLLAIMLLLFWLLARVHPDLTARGRQPMRWGVAAYFLALLASYISGELRGLTVIEANNSDRTMMAAAAMLGVALLAADGLKSRRQLGLLMRTLFWCGVFMSVVGILQFALRKDITLYIQPPGLAFQAPPVGFSNRGAGGLVRVAGTVGHYIEFSTLIAAVVVPLGLHYSKYAVRSLERQLIAVATVISACAIPLALSRTGIIAIAISMVVTGIAWGWQRRIVIGIASVMTMAVFSVIRPGLLGTLRALFMAENDPSISGRTDDYARVFPLISERPWLGRGTGTFVPELYFLLDNQWLLTLVSSGVVGVAGLVVLFSTGAGQGIAVWRKASRESDRHLAAVLVAGLASFAFSAFTFDALFFTSFVVTFGLLLGAVGALWRISGSGRPHDRY
ncbi:O-antigen ligase family protein [Longispora albida]|uniref:O-antigen ligase family protein n=1 Tax=Longispora albida TaxID=203523 RepID=UPI00036FB65B|nr:O-antigen ligase family protein [Longispora albida]